MADCCLQGRSFVSTGQLPPKCSNRYYSNHSAYSAFSGKFLYNQFYYVRSTGLKSSEFHEDQSLMLQTRSRYFTGCNLISRPVGRSRSHWFVVRTTVRSIECTLLRTTNHFCRSNRPDAISLPILPSEIFDLKYQISRWTKLITQYHCEDIEA